MDYRVEFSKWWTTEFKTIKFPSQGTVFDYFLDPQTHKWTPWTEKVPKFELDPEVPLQVSTRLKGHLPQALCPKKERTYVCNFVLL